MVEREAVSIDISFYFSEIQFKIGTPVKTKKQE